MIDWFLRLIGSFLQLRYSESTAFSLANALYALHMYKDATRLLRPLVRSSSSSGTPDTHTQATAHNLLALIAVAEQKCEAAIHVARRACELQPDVPDFWFTLATAHYHCFQYAAAIAAFERCLQLQSTDPRVKFSLYYSQQMVRYMFLF